MFITTATAMYILSHGLRTLPAVPRSTQRSTLRGTVKWISAFGLTNKSDCSRCNSCLAMPWEKWATVVHLCNHECMHQCRQGGTCQWTTHTVYLTECCVCVCMSLQWKSLKTSTRTSLRGCTTPWRLLLLSRRLTDYNSTQYFALRLYFVVLYISFTASRLSAGWRERHLARKKPVPFILKGSPPEQVDTWAQQLLRWAIIWPQ